jgi:hypothetical protein
LVLGRGTGGDNRTTKWSTNAIEQRTGISRSRAEKAIADLEQIKAVVRDPASKRSHPKYKIAPAHEVPGCDGFPPAALNPAQQRVFDQLGDNLTLVPRDIKPKQHEEYERWATRWPHKVADELVSLGRATRSQNGTQYRAVLYDTEAAAKPDWIWLPNELVDGAGGETPPVELVRQTGSAPTLRLLVDLYGAQSLDEDGGIHFRRIRQDYKRHKVGERGPCIIWGFVPDGMRGWRDAPFIAPHVAHALSDNDKRAVALDEFWACWKRLCRIGLVELVAHLVHADTEEGEIIHPMAREGTGLEVEQEIHRAAEAAALRMITQGQFDWAKNQGVVIFAPVSHHIEEVQMVGTARLRYRPKTNRTLAFISREVEWREVIARYGQMAYDTRTSARGASLATSRGHQG